VHPGSPATQTGRTIKLYDRRGQKVAARRTGAKMPSRYLPAQTILERNGGGGSSLTPKKKLRFKNKLLSLDASVIDLCLRHS
jgi:hypothetical protein